MSVFINVLLTKFGYLLFLLVSCYVL